jgi:hypothetical protein
MKRTINTLLMLFFMITFLIVPFKSYFVQSLHVFSHLVQIEDPYHTHSPGMAHHHHHDVLETLSHALDSSADNKDIPKELVNHKFQPHLPEMHIDWPAYTASAIQKMAIPLSFLLTSGPCYTVPLPPP